MIYDVKKLSFSYPSDERKILDGVSLELEKGQVLCILGPNGAGKTTLLNCMAGLLCPKTGDILLCGKNLHEMKAKEIARLVAYVPQIHTPSFDYSGFDFVLMGSAPGTGIFNKPSVEKEKHCMNVLKSMGLEELADKSYLNISGGERQQLLIARAIVQEPEVVLFDEPTDHLDFGNQHRVLKMVRRMADEGYSVVMTTHNPDHALLLGGKAAIVGRNGSLVQGECEEIVTEENLKKVYGIDLKLLYVDELGRKTCLVPNL